MPTMKPLDLIVVGLFLLGVGAQAQEPIPTLDLTKPLWCEGQLPTTISGIVGGTGGGLIHGPPPPRLPLDLRLVDIEPLPLPQFGKVVYEVELENVGAVPFLIPWGTICDVPWNDPNNPNKLSAGVSLILDEYPESDFFAYGVAYGMMNDPRTTRSLASGEKVRIRLSEVFNLSGSNTPDPVKKLLEYQEKAVIDVRGNIYLRGKPYRKYFFATKKSSNVLAVEVSRKPR